MVDPDRVWVYRIDRRADRRREYADHIAQSPKGKAGFDRIATMPKKDERLRLVLVAPETADPDATARMIGEALKGGDVASVILPQYGLDDTSFQKLAEKLVPIIQQAGAA